MRHIRFLTLLTGLFVWGHAGIAEAQGFQRWFQVELTIFSNESFADRERETWRSDTLDLDFPPEMVRLGRLTDLLFLELFAGDGEPEALEAEAEPPEPELARLRDTGPFPAREASGFRFPDLQRDPFLELPASYSDFRQTNQSIERAGQYRVLYDAVWRQPVGDAGSETPIFVAGGDRYGSLAELQGSVALNFNAGRDRVIFSADLWLAEFGGATGDGQWSLPPLPEALVETLGVETPGSASAPAISRIYTMRQQRELRSGEFHYLDHPALGIVVQITPYDLPPPFEFVDSQP
ncbi:MAG: CsiV family protein [Gammaproteobacteria bacterium]|nr:CsiV family protein [Gammaproteobacteria bacterium]